MPKLDLTRAMKIKNSSGTIARLKSSTFSWQEPAAYSEWQVYHNGEAVRHNGILVTHTDNSGVDALMSSWTGYADSDPAWQDVPANPTLTIEATSIPLNAAQAYVKLTVVGTIVATCYARIAVANGTSGYNTGGDDSAWRPEEYVVWRPGDDADHWVTITIPETQRNQPAGANFIVYAHVGPGGFASDVGPNATVTAVDGATNALPAQMPYHRAPLKLTKTTPTVSLDLVNAEWSSTGYASDGTTPVLRSRLDHGWAQPGNAEQGIYLNEDEFPTTAVNPISKGTDSAGRPYIRLHSQKLDAPVEDPGTPGTFYDYQAVALTTQMMGSTWGGRTGLYSLRGVIPDRPGAWPIFWTIGQDANGVNSTWPPEIDFIEHFNGAFGFGTNEGDWPEDASRVATAAQHCGVRGSNTRDRILGCKIKDISRLGFDPAHNVHTQIHDFDCLVTDRWLIYFRDGIETIAMANTAKIAGTDWRYYMLAVVSVKIPTGYEDYDTGSADFMIYGMSRHDIGQGYSLSEQTDAKPWANGAITPDPTDEERGAAPEAPPPSGNLVTNGGFDTDTDWTKEAPWTIGSGVASITTVETGTPALSQALSSLVDGTSYTITFDMTISSGSLHVYLGELWQGASEVTGSPFTTSGTKSVTFTFATGNTKKIVFTPDFGAGFSGSIDNVSVVPA